MRLFIFGWVLDSRRTVATYSDDNLLSAGWLALRHLPDRIFGTVMLAVAATAFGIGLVQLASPETAANLWTTLGIQLLAAQ